MIISLFQQSGGGGSGGKKGLTPPSVSSNGLVYDGTSKSPSISTYDSSLISVSYTSQTNAGTYTCTISLLNKTDNFWLDTYDTTDKSISWRITKAEGSSSLSKNVVEIGDGETDTVIVNRSGNGAVQASSSDTSVATVSVSGTTVTITGVAEGTATVSISVAADTNHEAVAAKTVGVTVIKSLAIVSWAGGTDEQIIAMVEAADAGEIDLTDYWAVGDERTVSLSAMTASGVGESHVAQDVTFVLMSTDTGVEDYTNPCWNYQYVTAKAGRSYPSFIVGQKNVLANGTSVEAGYMNSSKTNSGSWNGCKRRTWCNNVYYNAIPSTIKSIFKQVDVKTIQTYNGSSMQTSQDYFFLPAEREIFDSRSYSNNTEWNNLSQFDYYKTSANRIKYQGNAGAAYRWWERSPYYNNSGTFCYVGSGGGAYYGSASNAHGLAPCGCI